MSSILDKIVKLFRLADNNNQEAEMLAAVTRARAMMLRYKISQHEVQAALDAANGAQKSPRIEVNSYSAYTRKMRKLARYDGILAMAVAALTDTEPYTQSLRAADGGVYVSMKFMGDARFTALAGELFMLWLPEVRRAARKVYGSQVWATHHTSYAIGYATRILDRARAAVAVNPDASNAEQAREAQAMALVIQSSKDAIEEYKARTQLALKPEKRRGKIVPNAYGRGYEDGGAFNLNTKVVR